MTRQIKKSLLASAVAVAMGAGASVATADGILFPYLSKGASVTTLVTVINQAPDIDTGGQLHYMYNYKLPVAGESESAQNLRTCLHADFYSPTSKNDIVTFDAGGVLGDDANVLWDDPGAGPLRPYGAPFGLADAQWAGYLIVDNSGADLSLSGEAMSFDWGGGAAWGYEAYNPTGTDPYDYSSSVARNGEVLVDGGYRSPIDLVPMEGENVNLVERLLVTPIGDYMRNTGYGVRVVFGTPDDIRPDHENDVYDRNEKPFSIDKTVRVVCVGRVTVSAPGFWTASATRHLANGGWTKIDPKIWSDPDPANPIPGVKPTDEAVIQKLEYNTSDVGLAGTGTYNTAVWLRDMD